MSKDKFAGATEWRPTWQGKEAEYYAELRRAAGERNTAAKTMRAVRNELGLSQVEVARLLATTQSNVSRLETRGEPTLSIVAKMAAAKGKRARLVVEDESGAEASFALT